MSRKIGQEKVAYVSPGDSKWCVAIRDGTGLSDGIYTIPTRNYYDTAEKARKIAEKRVSDGRADRVELNVIAKRVLEDND